MKKSISLRIEYEVDKKSGLVVATIPELNHVSSFGETFAEAEANVKEAALGYLEMLLIKKRSLPKTSSFQTEGTYLKLFAPSAR